MQCIVSEWVSYNVQRTDSVSMNFVSAFCEYLKQQLRKCVARLESFFLHGFKYINIIPESIQSERCESVRITSIWICEHARIAGSGSTLLYETQSKAYGKKVYEICARSFLIRIFFWFFRFSFYCCCHLLPFICLVLVVWSCVYAMWLCEITNKVVVCNVNEARS